MKFFSMFFKKKKPKLSDLVLQIEHGVSDDLFMWKLKRLIAIDEGKPLDLGVYKDIRNKVDVYREAIKKPEFSMQSYDTWLNAYSDFDAYMYCHRILKTMEPEGPKSDYNLP